jgi:hypothetical protein
MNDIPGPQPTTGRLGKFPQIRRFNSRHLRPTRSPLLNLAILIAIFAAIIFVVYKLGFDPRSWVKSEVVDLSKSVEQIQELSTVKSHLRFTVVVREEGGNVIVRNLADQSGIIGMDDIGSALFENPTMIVALHGIATYGVRLNGLSESMTQNDSTVTIALPAADVLDVKLVAADTKIVAQMKGLFRSSNQSLLNAATIRGEEFARDFARQDTTLLGLADERARSLLQLIVERSGKRAVFAGGR